MRGSFDPGTFVAEFERNIALGLTTKRSAGILSRIIPSAIPTRFTNTYRLKNCRDRNLLILSIVSWYVPEELGILLRFDLAEKWKQSENSIIGSMILQSKYHMLIFLEETNLFHTRSFFGNYLKPELIEEALGTVIPIRSKGLWVGVNKPVRRRGYRDKGTYRAQSDKHEAWSGVREQQMIEEERKAIEDTQAFLEGFLFGG